MAKQSYIGLRQKRVTMEAGATLAATYDDGRAAGSTVINGSQHVEKAVGISGDGEVELVATNGAVFGQLSTLSDDGMCGVCDEGYVILPTDGTSITYGSGLVGGATAGTVKTGTSSTCIAVASAGTNKVVAKLH